MSQRIRDNLTDRNTIDSRAERLRKSHQLGFYIDEHTTIPGITPMAYKRKTADELRRDFMRRIDNANL